MSLKFAFAIGILLKRPSLNTIVSNIHKSGHAYIKDLQKFVDRIKPKYIIPIHTESKNKYKDLFNVEIKLVEDCETIKL